MEYNPRLIEPKWQLHWEEKEVYRVENDTKKPKYYVLDMFPYPSGSGLHVGHPLGYIASDILSRFKRLKGFNVLHPMGFDSFGLPAEQYAIETGQHPAITTAQNIQTFKAQFDKIGFSFDWSREVRTSNPDYYRWTQWIFKQLFESFYNNEIKKAEEIQKLITTFEKEGNQKVNAACDEDTPSFSANEWNNFTEKEKSDILLKYRLAYKSEAIVNWCAELGSVLAHDEIKDGLSERGGYPVERKKMPQWMMRTTAYADRLLSGLEEVEWSDALKEMQKNWIGKSFGAELSFKIEENNKTQNHTTKTEEVKELVAFTTRPDTIYGVTYIALAPELEIIEQLTTSEQKEAVENYVKVAKNRSERERQTEVKTVSGVFTGSYAINPVSGKIMPIWVADYVLSGYGTGVVMGVPSSDERDFRFATHFGLDIIKVIKETKTDENGNVLEAYTEKEGEIINSDFLNGMSVKDAIQAVIKKLEEKKAGIGKINFRLRDAAFGRQRYWGEPIPIYYKEGIPHSLPDANLPLMLPQVDSYKPTAEGEPPLGRAEGFMYEGKYPYELTTMPGWAGSSWYFLRYTDPQNMRVFASKEAVDYWNQVDVYIGGAEHAVGHLLYSRFFTKFLHDKGFLNFDEPFKKLVNQGMIQGKSSLIYRINGFQVYLSEGIYKQVEKLTSDAEKIEGINKVAKHEAIPANIEVNISPLHVPISMVKDNILDIKKYRKFRPETENAEFIKESNSNFVCGSQVEKMSKRLHNVVNPDDVVSEYSADALRLYEMFLGPLEYSKPWDTSGIDGVQKFLRKVWRLFYNNDGDLVLNDEKPTKEEFKTLHKTIKKVEEDIERLSLNTSVSAFMICVNELMAMKCYKREILEPFLIILSPFAPHIAEELWHLAFEKRTSIVKAEFPVYNEDYLKEDEFEYPISINGKVRAKMSFDLETPKEDIEKQVLEAEAIQKWLEGKSPKRFILVPRKIVNIVI